MRRFLTGFLHAGRGIRIAVRQHRNLRLQLLGGVAALALGLTLGISGSSLALVVLATGLVLSAELLNSAFETAIDALHPELHPGLGAAKDLAAGGVLLASIAAAVIGGLVLLPALAARFAR